MIKFGVLQKSIYDWITDVTGFEAVWMEQGQPRPQLPYVALKLINPSIPIGQDELRIDDDGTTVVCGIRELVCSINIYGVGALDMASLVQISLELPSVQDDLRDVELSYVDRTEVRNLTSLLENGFESRAQLDVRFRAALNLEDLRTGIIETVDIEGDIEDSVINADYSNEE